VRGSRLHDGDQADEGTIFWLGAMAEATKNWESDFIEGGCGAVIEIFGRVEH
jgi:hypothetical protein